MKRKLFLILVFIPFQFLFQQSVHTLTNRIITPNGTTVENVGFLSDTLDPCENDIYELIIYNQLISSGYDIGSTHIILASTTAKYNCHAYAWHVSEGGDLVWIGFYPLDSNSIPNAENIYWNDESYIPITSEELYFEATKINYGECPSIDNNGDLSDDCDHSAIMTNEPNIVISKWGPGFLLKHPIDNHPYNPAGQDPIINYYRHNSPAFCYILDVSGSMREYNKLKNAKLAIKQNVSLQDYGIDMGIVTFSSIANVYQNRIRLLQPEDKQTINNDIDLITAKTTTSIGAGLLGGHSLMQSSLRPIKNYIILSDGRENREPRIADVLDILNTEDIVYSIAFGQDADQYTMSAIAGVSGGRYYYIKNYLDPGKLLSVFNSILNTTAEVDISLSTKMVISPNTTNTHHFSIAEQTQKFEATVLWPNEDETIISTLNSPSSGIVINPNNANNIMFVNENNEKQYGGFSYTYGPGIVKIKAVNPLPGDWEVNIISFATNSITYSLSIGVKDNSTFDIEMENNSFYRGDPVEMKVLLQDLDEPIIDANVVITIETPNEITEEIELNDYGTDGDELAGDGVYSGIFLNTELMGSYQLTCNVSGFYPNSDIEFNRHDNFSFYISYHPDDVFGCMDQYASNYNPYSTIDDNSCVYSVHNVSPFGDDSVADGTIEYPFATVQEAINASVGKDTILIHPGTYHENLVIGLKEIVLASTLLRINDQTLVDRTTINGNSLGPVFTISMADIKIIGLALENGDALDGGGFKVSKSKVEIENSIIHNCTSDRGGAIYSFFSDIELKNTTISNNESTHGGAIYCAFNTKLTLLNSILWDNLPQQIYCSEEFQGNNIIIGYSNIQGGPDEVISVGSNEIWWGDNFNINPQFINTVNSNFALSHSSPMIDIGYSGGDPVYFVDFDSTSVDIGAHFYPQLSEETSINIIDGQASILSSTIFNNGLTIEEGSELLMSNNSSIIVIGDITVQGTEENPVIFTREDSENNDLDYWAGIKADRGSNIQISYANISGAAYGIRGSYNYMDISNSVFEENNIGIYSYQAEKPSRFDNNQFINSTYGLYCSYQSTSIPVYGNEITNCYQGLYLLKYNGTIRQNTISNNIYGISMRDNSSANMIMVGEAGSTVNNRIENNNYGFYIYSSYPTIGCYRPFFPNAIWGGYNTFNNTTYDINAYVAEPPLNAQYNYWDGEPILAGPSEVLVDPMAGDFIPTLGRTTTDDELHPALSDIMEGDFLMLDSLYVDAMEIYQEVLNMFPQDSVSLVALNRIVEIHYILDNQTGLLTFLDSLHTEPGSELIGMTSYDYSVTALAGLGNFEEAILRCDELIEYYFEIGSNENAAFTLLEQSLIYETMAEEISGNNRTSSQYSSDFESNLYQIADDYYETEAAELVGLLYGIYGFRHEDKIIPTEYALRQNYPNPFNPNTTIVYDVPEESHVILTIYDIMGRQVKELVNTNTLAGTHSIIWNGTDAQNNPIASGMYLYQLKSENFVETKKLVLLK